MRTKEVGTLASEAKGGPVVPLQAVGGAVLRDRSSKSAEQTMSLFLGTVSVGQCTWGEI